MRSRPTATGAKGFRRLHASGIHMGFASSNAVSSHRFPLGLWIATLVAAAAIRIFAASGDFWLDEIWSLQLASQLTSPLDAILRLPQSNNHPLNTLLLYWIGPEAHDVWYRVPAVLAGIASVAIGGMIGLRRGRAEGSAAVVLLASSYLLILYASEARGYSFVVLFALSSLLCLEEQRAPRRKGWIVAFWLSTWLGFLSQFTFVFGYAALLSWSLARARQGGVDALRDFALWNAPPLMGLVGYAIPHFLGLGISGAPPVSTARVVAETASATLGLPLVEPFPAIACAIVLALLLGAGVSLARRNDERWVLYLVGIAGPPIALLILRPWFSAPRYLLTSVVLLLLLLAELQGSLLRRRPAIGWGLLAAIVVGNLLLMLPLLAHGRGGYREALSMMAARSERSEIRVSSNHDFHDRMVFGYYARRLLPDRPFVYVTARDRPEQGTEWLLLHRTAELPGSPRRARDQHGNLYTLERRYAADRFSGFSFGLFRRRSSDPTAPAGLGAIRPPAADRGPGAPPTAGARLRGP